MNYKKPINEKRTAESDFEDLWEMKPVRIVIVGAAVLVSIYIIGKILRLMGETVEDVRSFSKAIKGK